LKTEPSTYSFADLARAGATPWNGVRNPQARGFLKEISKGDLALIYHTGSEKAVVGLAEITRAAYPEPDAPDWVQVDLKARIPLTRPVSLSTLKGANEFNTLLLVKQGRLSVMPVTAAHFKKILELGGTRL
jgi:predicted RNA-binding protein with PUA-like domain